MFKTIIMTFEIKELDQALWLEEVSGVDYNVDDRNWCIYRVEATKDGVFLKSTMLEACER